MQKLILQQPLSRWVFSNYNGYKKYISNLLPTEDEYLSTCSNTYTYNPFKHIYIHNTLKSFKFRPIQPRGGLSK